MFKLKFDTTLITSPVYWDDYTYMLKTHEDRIVILILLKKSDQNEEVDSVYCKVRDVVIPAAPVWNRISPVCSVCEINLHWLYVLKMDYNTKDSREKAHLMTICTTKLIEIAGNDQVQGRGMLNSVHQGVLKSPNVMCFLFVQH